jgi:hypothetical protein
MPEEIRYDPNQVATLKYQDGERNYQIETCQESLRQMHDRTLQYQGTREFTITRDGITHSTQTGQSVTAASPTTGEDGAPPEGAVTAALGPDEVGQPTGLDDEIRDAIQDALGKAREELQKVLADGVQVAISRTDDGGFDIKLQSLASGEPSGDEDTEATVLVLPEAGAEVASEAAVVEPGATQPKHTVSVGVAHPATDGEPSTSTFIPSAKADAESIGMIAVSTAVAINAPLISIQVTA